MSSQTENDSWSVRNHRRFVVIGGGISGLAAAYKLSCEVQQMQEPAEVMLLEGSPRLGGCISTYTLDDTILELGPDSFITDKPGGIELCRKLGIEDRLIQTEKDHRRSLVAHAGELFPVPEGFLLMAPTEILPLMSSGLFSWEAKFRMMQDLFIGLAPEGSDESLKEFTERRLGREVYERVVQPLVGGIYTGDPAKLSVKAALPRIALLEQKYGSLIKGLSSTRKKSEKEAGARYSQFVTFDEGMNVLVGALVSKMPLGTIRTHRLVSQVRPETSGSGWEIECFDGKKLHADGVILATSAYHAADILSDTNVVLADDLRKIEYASSAVLNLIYRRIDIPHPLDAFGFVVPLRERRTILACSFSSVKWSGRAPADKVLMRVFVGGALQPDVYDLSDEQIECLMWEDLRLYLGIRAVPLMSVISRFPRSMPQYNVGHIDRMKRVETALASMPGLVLAGNAYYGIGVPDCISSGERAADVLLGHGVNRPMPGTTI